MFLGNLHITTHTNRNNWVIDSRTAALKMFNTKQMLDKRGASVAMLRFREGTRYTLWNNFLRHDPMRAELLFFGILWSAVDASCEQWTYLKGKLRLSMHVQQKDAEHIYPRKSWFLSTPHPRYQEGNSHLVLLVSPPWLGFVQNLAPQLPPW